MTRPRQGSRLLLYMLHLDACPLCAGWYFDATETRCALGDGLLLDLDTLERYALARVVGEARRRCVVDLGGA